MTKYQLDISHPSHKKYIDHHKSLLPFSSLFKSHYFYSNFQKFSKLAETIIASNNTRIMGRKDWYYMHLPKLLIKRLGHFLQTPRAKCMGMSSKPELLRHLINQFLDEEEALCNKMDYVSDVILEMQDGDHAVFTFNYELQ